MRLKKMIVGLLGSIIAIGGFLEVATADLKFPMLVYRTGAYAPVSYTHLRAHETS